MYQDEDGMVVIHGRLEPETGAVLMKALEAAREVLTQPETFQDPAADPPAFSQQQADIAKRIHASYTAFRERMANWSRISLRAVLQARDG